MKNYGLPTFPIADGMMLGNREAGELEWLLDHGVIQSDIYRYNKIVKLSANDYRLFYMDESRSLGSEERQIDEADSLGALIEVRHIDIRYWSWYGKQERTAVTGEEKGVRDG